MTVKVKKVIQMSPFLWRTEKDGSHVLKRTATLCLDIRHGGIDMTANVRFCGESTDGRGFRCDGLSVPRLLRWFLPSWEEKNMLYNVSGALHDWLYTTKGNFGMFKRDECDDFFRGLLRESGIGRFKAGCADKAVEWFAGVESHWGNDSYGVASLVRMEVTTCSR